MGAWGYGIWENDTACDIELDVKKELANNADQGVALKQAIQKRTSFAIEQEEATLAFADLQIENDLPVAKEFILQAKTLCMEKKKLHRWQEPSIRAKVLDEFLAKINAYIEQKGEFEHG